MVVFKAPDNEEQILADIRELLYIAVVNDLRAETVSQTGYNLLRGFKERRVEK